MFRRGNSRCWLTYFLFSLLWLISFKPVLAYDHNITHPRLTSWSVQAYNLAFRPLISDQELQWLAAGAAAEDKPVLRTMNHFWWPQTDRPLSASSYHLMSLETAPDWAMSPGAQANLIYGPSFSWYQAIEAYRRGDYETAFINLGHVLHLLQDISVPAHSRNDPHVLGDALENWVFQHHEELAVLSALVRPRCQDYRDCFRQLASAVNVNYFSQDTVNSPAQAGDWPDKPAIKDWPSESGYIIYRGYRLVYYNEARRRFILDDLVLSDYWSQITPLTVGYGAELLRLFFEAVADPGVVPETTSPLTRWRSTIQDINDAPVDIIDKPAQVNNNLESSSAIVSSTLAATNSPVITPGATVLSSPNNATSEVKTTLVVASSTLQAGASKPKSNSNIELKRVIDGDTIELTTGEKVRYLGIDAPELASTANKASECLAEEAKSRNQALLTKGPLTLVADNGGDKDSYGRLLRYVYAGDVFVNKELALEGLAQVFFCTANQLNCPLAKDQARRQQIIVAGETAKQSKLGIYSSRCQAQPTLSTSSSTSTSQVVSSSFNMVTSSKTTTTASTSNNINTSTVKTNTTSSQSSADRQPPETTIKTEVPAITNTGTAQFILVASEPSIFECQLNDQSWKKCTADYGLKNLVAGSYTLRVRAIDEAANVDPTPAVFSWLIDKQRPAISWTVKPSSTMAASSITFAVEVNETADLFCDLDGGGEEPCPPNLIYDDLSCGKHELTVRARDRAGNYSAKLSTSWTVVDNTPPSSVVIDYPPADLWFTSSSSLTISGSADNDAKVLVNGRTAQSLANNKWRSAVTLAEGRNDIAITAMNLTGQTGPTSTLTIIVDKTKPSSSIVALPETVTESGFVVNWLGEDLGSEPSGHLVFDVQYRFGSESWQAWLEAVDYTSAIFDEPLNVDQKVAFRVRARDLVGNWENWPANSAADTYTTLIAQPSGPPPKIVISQLATRGVSGASDEFIELYNPNDETVDLTGWRLQSKSAEGSTWINRLGSDGLPEGSYIKAHDYFLLASADYGGLTMPDYQHGSNWGLADSGGHIRLVDSQDNVLDKVGYNQASDPEGQPALADLAAGHSLERKAGPNSTASSLGPGGNETNLGRGWDTDNNLEDFVDQPEVSPRSGKHQVVDEDSLSVGLAHLWHFDECLGETIQDWIGQANIINQPFLWRVGHFGCAVYQTWERPAVSLNLGPAIDPAAVTLAYWWRNASYPNEGRAHEYLVGTDGQIVLGLTPSAMGSIQFWHYGQYYIVYDVLPQDDNWHLLVASQENNQLKLYVDGQLKWTMAADYNPPRMITRLDLADENWPIDRDELAIWQRVLSPAEVRRLQQLSLPLSPRFARPEQLAPVAVYYWSFDEGDGEIAYDNLQHAALSPIGRWVYSPFNLGARISHPYDPQTELSLPLDNQDVSLSLWWRSSSYPDESRGSVMLHDSNGQILFGLVVGTWGLGVYFNGDRWYPRDSRLDDAKWHQAVLVYDSYAYHLSLYLDGRLYWQGEALWLTSPLTSISAGQENWPFELDELTIWQGALNATQVETIYELARPNLEEF